MASASTAASACAGGYSRKTIRAMSRARMFWQNKRATEGEKVKRIGPLLFAALVTPYLHAAEAGSTNEPLDAADRCILNEIKNGVKGMTCAERFTLADDYYHQRLGALKEKLLTEIAMQLNLKR
jgi:hypothetical protein